MHLPLHTERLVLRALTPDDLDDHHRLFGDPAVVRFLYTDALTRDEASTHLEGRLSTALPVAGGWMNLAVEHEGRYVGEVGLSVSSPEHRQCEIGYCFLPEAAGSGFATEAAAVMLALCFDELDAHRVAGRIEARNAASARVLERLGMRKEAHLRENEFVKGEWNDEVIYAITEDEWRAAGAPGRPTNSSPRT
jgi:RimJ/RimL family protein N-acetyltransferase